MSNALQFLILTTAGWVNRQQGFAIDYLREENRVLREQLGGKRPRLTDAPLRRLVMLGKRLGVSDQHGPYRIDAGVMGSLVPTQPRSAALIAGRRSRMVPKLGRRLWGSS